MVQRDEPERGDDAPTRRWTPSHDATAPTLVDPASARAPDAAPSVAAPLPRATGMTPAPAVDVSGGTPREEPAGDRYATRALLGEGGMGEVRLCRDGRIGRDVAMKVMRPGIGSHSDAAARFLREARVQGQLEHPAIVPVYDLAVGADGASYFTMKRIFGVTFDEVVEKLRAHDLDAEEQYTPRKLLSAFNSACLAVAFAHARGVLHRDLKPANVMMGEFGEVYVLDWGLAKVAGARELEPVSGEAPRSEGEAVTQAGVIMGTPGYMSPEQVRGDPLDARADLYALGAILFELLTCAPLHARDQSTEAVLMATVRGVDARPTARAPDRAIPIELEAICVRATAVDPNDRYPDVRAMVEDLDRFLDGDRDLERRRQLAEEHASAADRAVTRLALGQGDRHAARAEIIREVNRALAIDPTHARALQTMLRLLVEPPADAPPEAEAEIQGLLRRQQRLLARNGARAYLAWLLAIPCVIAMGVREPAPMLVFVALTLGIAGGSYWLSTRQAPHPLEGLLVYFVSMLALMLASSLFGPFLVVPTLMAVNTMLVAHSTERGRWRTTVIVMGACFAALPYALELLGLLPLSTQFAADRITIFPRGATFTPLPTQIFLAGITVLLVMIPAFFHARVSDDAAAAQRRMVLHLWQLRQFMPDEARGAQTSTPPPEADPILCMIRDTSDALHRSPWLRGHAAARLRRRGR